VITLLSRTTRSLTGMAPNRSSVGTVAQWEVTEQEVEGLRLFIGKAGCLNCHNGPLLTDNDFRNTGVPAVRSLPTDTGRAEGAQTVQLDPFNCLGSFSDATPEQCAELTFMKASGEELVRAFKTPSLRDVAQRAPFMHTGQSSRWPRWLPTTTALPTRQPGIANSFC
jgi:cytochrome c peroxidase